MCSIHGMCVADTAAAPGGQFVHVAVTARGFRVGCQVRPPPLSRPAPWCHPARLCVSACASRVVFPAVL